MPFDGAGFRHDDRLDGEAHSCGSTDVGLMVAGLGVWLCFGAGAGVAVSAPAHGEVCGLATLAVLLPAFACWWVRHWHRRWHGR